MKAKTKQKPAPAESAAPVSKLAAIVASNRQTIEESDDERMVALRGFLRKGFCDALDFQMKEFLKTAGLLDLLLMREVLITRSSNALNEDDAPVLAWAFMQETGYDYAVEEHYAAAKAVSAA